MAEQTIVVEAESVAVARAQLHARISAGFVILSEQILSDGEVRAIRAIADTPEAALARVRADLPGDAEILEQKLLATPARKPVIIHTSDEAAAEAKAERMATRELGQFGEFGSLRLIKKGSAGILGIGKRPCEYQVDLYREAHAQIMYRLKARVAATIVNQDSYIALLIERLRDLSGGAQGRVEAIQYLLRFRDERVLNALVQALDDDDADVRNHAAMALGDMGDAQAVHALIRAMQYGRNGMGTGGVRRHAAIALGKLGDQRAVPALRSALEDRSQSVRDAAAEALARLDPDSHWGKIRRALPVLCPLPKEAIDQMRGRAKFADAFRDPDGVLRRLQEEREKYNRLVEWAVDTQTIRVCYDDFVKVGANASPPTRRLDMAVVTDGQQFFAFAHEALL